MFRAIFLRKDKHGKHMYLFVFLYIYIYRLVLFHFYIVTYVLYGAGKSMRKQDCFREVMK